MKIKILLILILMMFIPSCATDYSYKSKSLTKYEYVSTCEEALLSTVKLDIEGNKHASAFYIGNSLYVTAGHCVVSRKGDPVKVYIQGKEAEVVSTYPNMDIAILKLDTNTSVKAFNIYFGKVEFRDEVYSVGTHFGYVELLTIGKISNPNYKGFIVTNAAINPGCSGGPLLNDRFEVIGINSNIVTKLGTWDGVSCHGSSVHLLSMLEVLAKLD